MDINKLIYSECQHPVTVSIYNGIKGCYEQKQVPCGKCYHCKITRINEWVTRMVIQSKDVKYVYFGTLTYSSLKPTKYIEECLCYDMKPMVLRKDHVQKFFKRLRKNTGIKLQYAYCGEYGEKRSRPHYHYIIWCNSPIRKSDIYKAWRAQSIDNPNRTNIIGRIDHVDIKNNPRQVAEDGSVDSVYKYVCKYMHKVDFDFYKLKNYKQHEKNFHSRFKAVSTHGIKHDDYIKKYNVETFEDYQKMCRPFFQCSKKPAIGYCYLQRHIERFQNADFRLHEISGEYLFPLYFIRKTKESLCPLKAQSEINDSTTSYSRLPKMAALINNIQIAQSIAEDTDQIIKLFTNNGDRYTLQSRENIQDLEQIYDDRDKQSIRNIHYTFKREYLGFTNIETGVRYVFRYNNDVNPNPDVIQDNSAYFAMFRTKDDVYIGEETLQNVKQLITYYYERLKQQILLPLMAKSEISANKKEAMILEEFGDYETFLKEKELCLQQFNANIEERQRKYKQALTLE